MGRNKNRQQRRRCQANFNKFLDLDIEAEQFRAVDKVRKRIERAVRDLRVIGALEVNSAGYLSTLRRLPEIRRVLEERGVAYVRLCPGGKRALCDVKCKEIRRF